MSGVRPAGHENSFNFFEARDCLVVVKARESGCRQFQGGMPKQPRINEKLQHILSTAIQPWHRVESRVASAEYCCPSFVLIPNRKEHNSGVLAEWEGFAPHTLRVFKTLNTSTGL